MSDKIYKSPFYNEFDRTIKDLGGMFNAHLHLDRAGTIEARYVKGINIASLDNSHISLEQKHTLISIIHDGPAYDSKNLAERVNYYLDFMISVGTTRANTVVDVTCDRVGLSALETMLEIKRQRSREINLKLGAYSPLGFKDSEPERWDLFLEGAEFADFLGSLPERDDIGAYPDHIGFYEHCRRILSLGKTLNKTVHMHIDQRNEPSENGTEIFLKALKDVGGFRDPSGIPMVWLVHVISPSTYDEPRFNKVLAGLVENNIGVICCPSAAISMRQFRPLQTPTYNSIARVLEMLAAGVHVCIGSDNIADICSPAGTPDLTDEVFVLSNAIRFYHVGILAKLAAGVRLGTGDRQLIKSHLENNDREITQALKRPSQKK